MVQVDVLWSYGLGAGFAVAASRQLGAAKERNAEALSGPYFSRTLLFLSALFAPSGICLLWAFPSWETMHVGDRDMPAWLVTAFALTNVTQGVLGYWLARRTILKGRRYRAYLHWLGAYFGMFFILVHGWDGSGYRRFFSATRQDFLEWHSGHVAAWFGSDVAMTLYGMGVLLVPVLLYTTSKWLKEGYAIAPSGHLVHGPPRALALSLWTLAVVFVGGLGSAIVASLLVRWLGWVPGVAVFALLAYALGVRRGGLYARLYARLLRERPQERGFAGVDARAGVSPAA